MHATQTLRRRMKGGAGDSQGRGGIEGKGRQKQDKKKSNLVRYGRSYHLKAQLCLPVHLSIYQYTTYIMPIIIIIVLP